MSKDLMEIRAQAIQLSRGNSIPGTGNNKCKGSEARNMSKGPVWLEQREQKEKRGEIREACELYSEGWWDEEDPPRR